MTSFKQAINGYVNIVLTQNWRKREEFLTLWTGKNLLWYNKYVYRKQKI